ncbi:MAG: response regulator transcription factor [Candidatus Gracilibacteria bacterium]
MKILIVEDNELLSNNIKTYLKLKNIETKQLFTGTGVNYELTSHNYDLVILDIGLPEVDGIEVCKQIRNSGKNIPILILTARSKIDNKISGFNAGADDYLTKPFEYEELLMRINALVRRDYTVKSENIKLGGKDLGAAGPGNIELNINSKKITKDGKNIHLSPLELDLLIYLVHNKGKVISKEKLFEKIWGEYDNFKMSRNVDVYIGYIRKKLGKEIIDTIRGEGYIIN